MKLTNHYIKKKIRKLALQAPSREHSYMMLEEAQNVLLVYSDEDREIAVNCIQALKDLGKNVSSKVGEEEETNLLMIPKVEQVDNFKQLPADILIDLSRSSDYVMKYLVLSHPAMLKVGKKDGEPCLHDISLVMDGDNVGELFNQIVFYLQTIHSKSIL